MSRPLYFVPPDCAAPAHLKPELAQRLLDQADDSLVAGVFGGKLYGGKPGPAFWEKCAPGWYVNSLGPTEPRLLARFQAPAVLQLVEFDKLGLELSLPQLLDGHGRVLPEYIHSHSALDAEGQVVVQTHIAHQATASRLEALLLQLLDGSNYDPADPELYALAAEILGLVYHVSSYELAAWGWLSDETALAIIMHAAGCHD